MQAASETTCYRKLQKGSIWAFIILLGSGSAMALSATVNHRVILWSMGTVLAGMSGIFVTLGLVAKNKLR